MKREQNRLNSSNVKASFRLFMGYFTALIFLSFISILFFYKSFAYQKNSLEADIISYKNILNKQQIIEGRIDTLYHQMSLISTDHVENDILLSKYIMENIQDTKNLIDKDSILDFKHYAFLLGKMDSMMILKNSIIEISEKEKNALNDLNACMGKMNHVNIQILHNPHR